MSAVSDTLLRPALEAAVAVARAGEDAMPVERAPSALQPFLRFTRLPPTALKVARRVLEEHEPFRARVAEEVSEEEVGQASWLFLARPDGWERELDELVRRAEEEQAAATDRRAENDARRRVASAEAAARRAGEAADAARSEASRAQDALMEERRARRETAQQVEELVAERDRAQAAEAAAGAELEAARRQMDELRAELDALRASAPSPSPGATIAGPEPATVPTVATAEDSETAVAVPRPDPRQPAHPEAGVALAAAARAARGLADALADAAGALGAEIEVGATGPDQLYGGRAAGTAPSEESGVQGGGEGPTAPASTDHLPPALPRRRVPERRRVPAPLPPGISDDSTEAAEHLARLRGVVLLVDGYNVSHAAWPGTPIREQRRRLVDALGELAARTGADVRVVFDGSETVDPPSVSSTSRVVRVRFSPPGVEADDVIVAEVAALPAERPVVVASSDGRVRDECRSHGANLLRSSQLLALLHQ